MKEMGEPVAGGLAHAGLVLHVVREVRERVALCLAALVGDVLVAAGEADRLEGEGRLDLLRVVERELDDALPTCSLLMPLTMAVTGDDVDAGLVQVVDGTGASRRTRCRPCGASWRRCRYRRTAGRRSGGRLQRRPWQNSSDLANSIAVGRGLDGGVTDLARVGAWRRGSRG